MRDGKPPRVHTPLRERDSGAIRVPDKIILSGSHAYGTPHEDSDVDIPVVMLARNEIDQAVRICLAWRLAEGD